MTPDERDALALEIAELNKVLSDVQATLGEVGEKMDIMQTQNVRHLQHLQGDFKQAVIEQSDKASVLAYESSELYASSQRQNLRLGEINAQLVERLEPLCDHINSLTGQIQGLIGLTKVRA